MFKKLGFVFNIIVYIHRFNEGLNDLRYEFYNAASGMITWPQFFKQIKPTMMYHLSGEFEQRIAEIMKEDHRGI